MLFGFLALSFVARVIFRSEQRLRNMLFAGIFLGLSFSIKWNGLGFWLALTGLLVAYSVMGTVDKYRAPIAGRVSALKSTPLILSANRWTVDRFASPLTLGFYVPGQ